MQEMPEVEVDRTAGLSGRRERRWGVVGGMVGSLAGVGAALVAVLGDGASWYESGPYPRIFESGSFLALDFYLLFLLLLGAGFQGLALVSARRSPYPRTEAFGAGLMGLVLSTLAGSILFVRLFALLRAD
jgi:hypothetical protein